MKKQNSHSSMICRFVMVCLVIVCFGSLSNLMAQDSTTSAPVVKKKSFIKNTFEGNFILDNQTVMVPIKGTFEFDIQHRFGTTDKGIKDLFGIFATANTRLGFSYTLLNRLQIGFGVINDRMQVDFNLKYAILKQTRDGAIPVSITYFGNALMDTRIKDNTTLFVSTSDRFSFFNQLILARKVSEKISIQVSPSLTHFNNLEGYLDATGKVMPKLDNEHFAVAFSGRYKISPKTAIVMNYDQPLTTHPIGNPHPNISVGLEMNSSGHAFEVFAGNYGYILPQNNNLFNQNDFTKGQFVIGFNITRLWNF
jgi:archaellum component FlaG (FlaF/FlaG flagellin family)